MIMSSSPDIDDDFPDTTLLSDEDIAAILSSTTAMFTDNNNHNNNGGERRSAMEEEEEEKPVIRKRCRASKHTPSTFLIAKPCDFRALVQQLTGCQSADSSYKGPINLNFGAAEDHPDHYTAADRLDTPMLAFTCHQNNTHVNKKKKINDHCHDFGGQQRLLYYEEQESSSNSNSNNGTDENKLDNYYSMIIRDNYDENNSFLAYGSDQYSSPAVVAETETETETDHVPSNGDYCYSLDYVFLNDDSTALF